MNRAEIFKTLWHHRALAEKRSLIYSQNRVAKFIIGIMSVFVIGYLMFFAVLFSLIANDSRSLTTMEFIMSLLPFILVVDFGVRWLAQQTPSQIVKQYILFPLPRYACIDAFIIRSIFNWENTIWLALLIPYCIMSVLFSYGFGACLIVLFTYILFIFANSQWYAIVRSLIVSHIAWWLMPIAVYCAIFSPLFFDGLPTERSFDNFFDLYSHIGTMLEKGNLLPILLALVLLGLMAIINRKVQYSAVMTELGRTQKVHKMGRISKLAFLNRYGEIGEYLKLEIKSLMRNMNPRKSFITATFAVISITAACCFSDIYDDLAMTNFWCLYNLVVYAAIMLVKIMCYEGNYIDALMIRKENILSLLRAKYFFFCALLVFPVLLLMPTVITGKWTIGMIIAYTLFTAGFQYFIIFQLAVYNKTTIPLNTKFTSKNGFDNNYIQLLASCSIFILPMALVMMLNALFAPAITNLVMSVIGATFIATNKLWLRNIYNRMMKRRYDNLEGFRTSR